VNYQIVAIHQPDQDRLLVFEWSAPHRRIRSTIIRMDEQERRSYTCEEEGGEE